MGRSIAIQVMFLSLLYVGSSGNKVRIAVGFIRAPHVLPYTIMLANEILLRRDPGSGQGKIHDHPQDVGGPSHLRLEGKRV